MHISVSPLVSDGKYNPRKQTSFFLASQRMAKLIAAALFLAFALPGSDVGAQETLDVAPPPSHEVPVNIDSGMVGNETVREAAVWNEIITVPGAKWLRLNFGEVVLTEGKMQKSRLKITALEDGAVQYLDATCCKQWRNKSAYFNGNAVKIELLAHGNAEENCVVIEDVTAGEAAGGAPLFFCDGVDSRIASNSRRVARIDIGCTAWLFDDRPNDMITAGHCAPFMTTVFFNVPLSDPDGTLNFPSPDDQYAICADSVQFTNGGIGNDWCYFGVFNNSNTGLSPLAAQGSSYTLVRPEADTFDTSDFLRINGFGSTTAPADLTLNQAQKTIAGRYVDLVGNELRFETDATGGDSGSPISFRSTNLAYGVVTHGGCFITGGSNRGTGLNHPDFWEAINNPQGVCVRPENDNCEDATVIKAGIYDFDTINATTDGPDLPTDCEEGFGLRLVNDIWFEYVSHCNGRANFDFCESNYDTRVAAYASCGGGTLIACNDDSCGLQSEMTFNVVEGESYWIRVGGFSGSGAGTMVVTCTSDDCSEYVEVDNGTMTIVATGLPDEITVNQFNDTLIVNVNDECVERFPMAEVNQIVVFGYGGSDLIRINARVETMIHGGPGADMIFGGRLCNDIIGGLGEDTIVGGPADDLLSGGAGDDILRGFGGNDQLQGGGLNDTLNGGAGDDTLLGGLGKDTLLGGNGNDLLVGNGGDDIISGNGGNDELMGEGGADQMIGGPGNDEFTGGPGADTMNGGGGNDTALDVGEVEIGIEN